MYTFPDISNERQNPHSPERHFEGGFKFALSKDTNTDSVAIAGNSLISFPMCALILKVFSFFNLVPQRLFWT